MPVLLFAQGNHKTKEKLLSLRREAHHDKQPRIALRIQGIILSLDKHTTGEIASLLKVNRTTIPIWINNWNEEREEGLKEGIRSGRPTYLTSKNLQELYDIIESGPVAYGLNTGVWTSPLIADIIYEEFKADYHPGHVRKILKKLRLSVQRPTVTIVTGKPENKDKWHRYRYPRVKKKPSKKEP